MFTQTAIAVTWMVVVHRIDLDDVSVKVVFCATSGEISPTTALMVTSPTSALVIEALIQHLEIIL